MDDLFGGDFLVGVVKIEGARGWLLLGGVPGGLPVGLLVGVKG